MPIWSNANPPALLRLTACLPGVADRTQDALVIRGIAAGILLELGQLFVPRFDLLHISAAGIA